MNGEISKLFEHQKLVAEIKKLIEEVYLMDKIPWVIGYSGGKDSTATTQIIIETLLDMREKGIELTKAIYVISSDTLVETPMIINTIKNTIDKINDLAKFKSLPVKAKIIRPAFNRSFWANLIGRGYPCPNQTFRWCTDRMKIEPANKFIENVVSKYGEAVMVLGVRDNESNSRDRVLETHTIEGKKLMRHTTMPNAYVFAPIRRFSIDDVWNYLLENNSPWGADNHELFKLYSDSSSECPLIIDEKTKNDSGSCGNSRFGCWVCTVVKKDKSLSGFIDNGILWLKPLLEYRNWLFSIRDQENLRMKRRTNGNLYFSKIKTINQDNFEITVKGERKKLSIKKIGDAYIDSLNEKWYLFDGPNAEDDAKNYISKNCLDLSNGKNPRILVRKMDDECYQLGDGPFTLDTRKDILRRLLVLQRDLTVSHELIKKEELLEIKKCWIKEGDWLDSVNVIYKDVYGKNLDDFGEELNIFSSDDMEILTQICNENNYNITIYNELIQLSKKYSGYINRKETLKDLQKVLSKEFIYLEHGE